jgi:hypothetical protein
VQPVVYAPPTLEQLRARVAADLRDPLYKTFMAADIDALINGAVVEVSRAYPKQVVSSVVYDTGVADYPVDFTDIFRVEVFRDGVYAFTIPPNESDDSAQGGYDTFAGAVHLPWYVVARLSETTDDSIRLWGYRNREIMETATESLDGDAEFEHGVRTYSVLTGYQRLANSRALFQQWTQDSNNTDVSPTQLLGMAQAFESQWQHIRQQLRTLRRR